MSFRSDAASDLQPIHLWQAEVENYQVDAPRQGPFEGLRAIRAHLYLIALPAQGSRQWLGYRGVILGEKNAGHGAIVGP
ncbi:hypothetical protein Pth03_16230 [Planotetraspora thailandica]|uniref:Uncharacterized protein n=1 Tax=Planotetraspora thailandica TaxID=487172 RepID=A0A8J3V381_9ACTN|nr:hypothetical protein Pth03_16230 [Planotetraspora thailandica]